MARKYQEVLFDGLHIGNIVRDVLNNLKIQQIEAGESINISPTGIYHRLKNPEYASIYDLIKTSIAIKTDLLGIVYNELNKRFPQLFNYQSFTDALVKQDSLIQENNRLRRELEICTEENQDLLKIISRRSSL
ncbi:MAG: hypothetical protein IPI45_04390 [Saprospiraceae bacterium]|nr:hypothetical protein [Saprospiraceae bacterium]MBK7737001.1 hypothetical protein [Saprospiraceae bacterium]MBK7914405.1 hypothetical protein [Saprospiraceae bacterium]